MKPKEDMDIIWDLLPEISRTFAFTIPKLPKNLARDLAINYTICRVIDTIEDSKLENDNKENLMKHFIESIQKPYDENSAKLISNMLYSVPTTNPGYKRMLKNVDTIIRVFHDLKPATKDTIIRLSSEMTQGFSDPKIQTINTMDDQNTYCYYAAGIVGYMINEHLMHHGYITPQQEKTLRPLSKNFGLALQKVNIIKDISDDIQDGREYWPKSLLHKHGMMYSDLNYPTTEDKIRACMHVLDDLIKDTQTYIHQSLEYINQLPFDPAGIKIFCGDNLMMAIATLRVAYTPDLFSQDKKVKITRDEVISIDAIVTDLVKKKSGLNEFAQYLRIKPATEFKY